MRPRLVSLPTRTSYTYAKSTQCIASAAALFICAALLLTGCGSQSYPPALSQDVAITTQPLSQTVPISQTATFTVVATGVAPLSYQWSENGTEIPGATSASYTTPAVALGPNGSTSIGSFQVTVSSASSSATSNAVTLSAGPRSPKAGDLRYLLTQQVDLPGLSPTLVNGVSSNGTLTATNAIGTPLTFGPGDFLCVGQDACAWSLVISNLPSPMTGLSMFYQADNDSNFTSDLQSIVAPNIVVNSLDIEPAYGAFAMSCVGTTQAGGFDYKLETVSQAQLQATADADSAASRVITAAAFDGSGNVNLISYGWTGDTTTVYETQTTIVPQDEVVSAATTLAGEGYIISAFGGNDIDGYMLIGMRVAGDTLPRSTVVGTLTGTTSAPNPDTAYFTTVVYLTDPSEYVTEQ